jgi:hypothetical protein
LIVASALTLKKVVRADADRHRIRCLNGRVVGGPDGGEVIPDLISVPHGAVGEDDIADPVDVAIIVLAPTLIRIESRVVLSVSVKASLDRVI